MARRFREELMEWSKGAIVTDITADKIPKDSSSRAHNVAFLKGGFPSKRKGVGIVTPAAQSGRHPILALDNALGMNWVIDDLGRWSKVDVNAGTFAAIDAGHTTPFTAGTHYPSTTTAKNLLFAANGIEAKKTDGTTVMAWGFAPPAAPTVVDSGVAGNPTGTYTFGLTALNENTGHESSLSATTSVTVAGKKITVSWVFPSDTQITKVRVHIFKLGLSSQFFRLGSTDVTPTPDPTTGGYSSGTLSITVNVTDADINNLIIASPSQTENNPPPAGITFCQWHNGRMFVTDGNYLYFSKLDDPESFDPVNFEVVNTNDNQKIKAMAPLADFQLIIWKDGSSHILIGPDPASWSIQPLDPSIGLSSIRAITFVEGAVWWEALQGLFRLEYAVYGIGRPQRVDAPNISDRLENLNDALLGSTAAAYDSVHQRMFFAVPDENSASRNTLMLPFNTKLKVFEDTWDPMDVSALGVFVVNSVPVVVIGGYQGRVFQMWTTPYVDGVRQTDGVSVTFTLTGKVVSATATTLTDGTATFDTANDGLREVCVVAVSPQGLVQRNIIASNTSTVLTLVNNWNVQPDSTWSYYIGNPWFEFDTVHMHPTSVPNREGSALYERTFKQILVRATSDAGASLDVYSIIDGDFSNFATHNSMAVMTGGAVWDLDKWDLGKFGSNNITTAHQSLGARGRTCGIRVQSRIPGDAVILLSLGLYGTEHSYKR